MSEKSYNILAINPGHNGSVAFTVNGELIFYAEEERVSRLKYDGNPFRAMLHVLLTNTVDEFVIGGTNPVHARLPWTQEDSYSALVRKFNPNVKITNLGHLHHLGHAAAAFYGSGFESAAAVIVDGAGSVHEEHMGDDSAPITRGFETESIYHCNYPHEFRAVYKHYSDGAAEYYDNGVQEFDNSVTITKAYEAVSFYLGFGFIESGKTMGLSPYGSQDSNIPQFFVNNRGNKNLLIPKYPAGAIIDEARNPYLRRNQEPAAWHRDFNKCRDVDKNLAYHVQRETEEMMYQLIQRAIDSTEETNVVISGGYGLNCVANYKYLKKFPNIRFHVDPIAHDGGTAIGLAQYAWYKHSTSMKPSKMNTVYLGAIPDYSQLSQLQKQVPQLQISDVTKEQVVDLLLNQNIVALFQGPAEGGPRALGNRSLLFDPRVSNAKDIMNSVKMREWFRPFAGTVLEQHANEWFDMATLDSSPFMMYAVDTLPEKVNTIPGVCHVDGTCRVQTVTAEQNKHYYDLIETFYKKTGVPIIMNTSFNIAGQPLVETILDAVITMFNSNINYIYLPELGKMLSKNA